MARNRLLYIISPSFSGSTLLTLLLARHPKVATIGELKATARGDVESYMCSCGKRLLDCGFWREIKTEAKAAGIDFSLEDFGTHFRSSNRLVDKIIGAQVRGGLFESVRKLCINAIPPVRSTFRRVMRQNETLIDLILKKQKASYFIDGSKDPNRLLYFLESGKWEVTVINITRNGISQANSQRSRPHYPGTFADATREWSKTMKQIHRACEKVPAEMYHTLKYEDLCSNTSEKLDQIWDFLELPRIECNPENLDLKTKDQHILGNKMRTKDSITIRLDERWRSQVSENEFKQFEEIAGSVNHEIGYK